MKAGPTNRAYGSFGLATSARPRRAALAAAAALFAFLTGLGAQITTQWAAHQLGHQRGLGLPAFAWAGMPVYAPWKALQWRSRLAPDGVAGELAAQIAGGFQVALVLGVVAAAALLIRSRRGDDNRTAELHGSAHWATRKDVEATGLLAGSGVVLGRWPDPEAKRLRWLRSDGAQHILFFAPTGSGKGVGPVLSTLLTWAHSVVVYDPKGENFALTSGWRSSFSRCFRVDFTDDPAVATAYNPLAEVRIRSAREVADVQRIALQLLTKGGDSPSEASQYFINAGADLLTGAILHVLYRESLKGRVATLADVAHELSDPERPHGKMLDEWLAFAHDAMHRQRWRDKNGQLTQTHPIVAKAARTQKNRDPRDRSPILSTVTAALAVFCDPLLVANTSRSDFTVSELVNGDKPVSLYLVLRLSDQERLRPLVRLLLDLWIGRLTEDTVFTAPAAAEPPAGATAAKSRRRLLFLLDEFPVLGRLTIVETALAAARGWGIKFLLIAQDYEQIVGAYGKHESLFANCAIRAAYAPNNLETARLLSSLAGTTTVLKENASRSGPFGAPLARTESRSEQEVKRDLITPDECMRLPGPVTTGGDKPRIVTPGRMLVFAANAPPIYAEQALYYRDSTLLERAQRPPAPPRPSDIEVLKPGPDDDNDEAPQRSAPLATPPEPQPVAATPTLDPGLVNLMTSAPPASHPADAQLLEVASVPWAETDDDDGGERDGSEELLEDTDGESDPDTGDAA